MKTHSLVALILVVQVLAPASGQAAKTLPRLTTSTMSTQPQQSPTPQPSPQTGDDEVVRISTKLVQVDAVITDKNGKLVTDLHPEEVRILEDGRPQKVT